MADGNRLPCHERPREDAPPGRPPGTRRDVVPDVGPPFTEFATITTP